MSIIRKIAKTLGRKSTLFNWNEQIRIRIFLFFAVFPFVSGLGQNTPEEFIKKGKFHQEYGQWSDAIKDYSDALALNPNFVPAYIERALVKQIKGELREAVLDLDLALALDTANLRALNARGALHYDLGNYNTSLKDLNHALKIHPNYVNALLNRGKVLEKLGEKDAACRDFMQVELLGDRRGLKYRRQYCQTDERRKE